MPVRRSQDRPPVDNGEPLPPEPPEDEPPPDDEDSVPVEPVAAAKPAPAPAQPRDPEEAAIELITATFGARAIDKR